MHPEPNPRLLHFFFDVNKKYLFSTYYKHGGAERIQRNNSYFHIEKRRFHIKFVEIQNNLQKRRRWEQNSFLLKSTVFECVFCEK